MSNIDDLPEITDAVLDQWERSARADAEVESSWATNPLAILAVIRDLRDARAALARILVTESVETLVTDAVVLAAARAAEPAFENFDSPLGRVILSQQREVVEAVARALIASGAVRPAAEVHHLAEQVLSDGDALSPRTLFGPGWRFAPAKDASP